MTITRFLFLYNYSHLKKEPFKILITVLSIAIGVASYFSIKLANENALKSFESSLNLFAESSDLNIVSATGDVSEDLIQILSSLDFIESISPLSSRFVSSISPENGTRVQIIGIDLFSNKLKSKESDQIGTNLFQLPYTCLTAKNLKLDKENNISLRIGAKEITLHSHSIVTDNNFDSIFGGKYIICDISIFQQIFNSFNKVDRLDLVLKNPETLTSSLEAIKKYLPEGIKVIEPKNLPAQGLTMTEAFRFNLNFLASISLLLAGLLVYNTSSYFAIKRRREYSILHSLGMKKKDILMLGLAESLSLGLIGSIAGMIIGYLIALQIIGTLYETITTLYLPIEVSTVHLSTSLITNALIIGLLTSFCGAILPQFEASFQSLNAGFFEQAGEKTYLKRIPIMFKIGLGLSVVSLLLAHLNFQLETISRIIPLVFIVGIVFVIPALFNWLIVFNKILAKHFGGIQLKLAIDHISQTMRRNVSSVTSMVLAIGFCIGISSMIISFRLGVESWIKQALQADLFISPSKSLISSDYLEIPEEMIQTLGASKLVKDVDFIYPKKISFRNKLIEIAGVSFEIIDKRNRLEFIAELDKSANQGDIYISEVISRKFSVGVGDFLKLPTDSAYLQLKVTKIFRDYSSDRGLVMIPVKTFKKAFKNSRASGVSLYLKKNTTREMIENFLLKEFPQYQFFIRDNKTLRDEVLDVFDKTFRITYALVGISLLISLLAIFNSILMLLLERKRDFQIFQTLGARKSFITKIVTFESIIIGINSSLIGLVVGLILANFLVNIVTPQFFGWSFTLIYPVTFIYIFLSALLALSVLAGLLPTRFILANNNPSEVRHVD